MTVKLRAPRTLTPRRPVSARRHVAEEQTPLTELLDSTAPWPLILPSGIACLSVMVLFIVALVVLADPMAVPTPTPGPPPVAPLILPSGI